MGVVADIFRNWGWRLAMPSGLAVLCAGCYNAAPPSDEWLKENFRAHRADFDSVVAIVGSAAGDDFVRYPPDTTAIYDSHTGKEHPGLLWSKADSLFVTGLGDGCRARLDSLLHRINCTAIECYPPNGMIDIVCTLTETRTASRYNILFVRTVPPIWLSAKIAICTRCGRNMRVTSQTNRFPGRCLTTTGVLNTVLDDLTDSTHELPH